MTWITLVSAPFAPHSVHDMDHTTCISTFYTPQRLWHGSHLYQHPLHPTASMTWITPRVSAPFTPHSVYDMDHTACISTLHTPQRPWHGSHHVYQHPLHLTASMTWISPRVSAPFTSHSVHDMDHTCISTLHIPQRPWHRSHVYQHPLHPTASMTLISPRVSVPFTPGIKVFYLLCH